MRKEGAQRRGEAAGNMGGGVGGWASMVELRREVRKKHKYEVQLCRQVGHPCGLLWRVYGPLRPTKREQSISPGFSGEVSPRLVSGLVKEDVARLGVLGDFRRETIEFFYSLCINFLKRQDSQETK